jgi:hypothetical protein
METPLPNYNIFLRSSEYTSALNENKSNLSFELNQPIQCYSNMDILVSLEAFQFTNSFYTINEYNCNFYFSFSETGTPYNKVTATKGNYDIDTLLLHLTTLVGNGFSFSYSPITTKVNIINATPFLLCKYSNNMYEVLGFDDYGTKILSSSITSPYLYNLISTQILHVCIPNLNFSSVGIKNKTRYNILSSIHINALPTEVQCFKNTSKFQYKITDNEITFLNIIIYDQDFNIVNFNNIDWFLNVSFKIIYRPELLLPPTLLDNFDKSRSYEYYLKLQQDKNLRQEIENYYKNKK